MPIEYLGYVLCMRYHVLPSQLREEPLENLLVHLTCMEVESQVAKLNSGGRGP